MAKDPAALIYIDKWIAATQGMKGDAKGWYLDLILHQYDKGDLPNDVDELASICRIRPSEFNEFEQVFEQVLKQKFERKDNGRLEQPFAREIIQGRSLFKDERSKSGKWSYIKRFIFKNYGFIPKEKLTEIYENFDYAIDLKNEQVFKQVLEQKFELYINVNTHKDVFKEKENGIDEKNDELDFRPPIHKQPFRSVAHAENFTLKDDWFIEQLYTEFSCPKQWAIDGVKKLLNELHTKNQLLTWQNNTVKGHVYDKFREQMKSHWDASPDDKYKKILLEYAKENGLKKPSFLVSNKTYPQR